MSEPLITTCACGVTTIGRKTLSKRSLDERHRLRDQGIHPRRRGMCQPCYLREIRDAEPTPTERRKLRRHEVLEEWSVLYDGSLSVAENCRRIAPRLGMRWRTLERAVERAGIGRVAA